MIILAFFNGAQQRLGPRPGLVRGEAPMVANRRSSLVARDDFVGKRLVGLYADHAISPRS